MEQNNIVLKLSHLRQMLTGDGSYLFITRIARTTGASLSPVFTGPLLANAALLSFPFFISGVLKIIYDLLLYCSFCAIKPPEESQKTEV